MRKLLNKFKEKIYVDDLRKVLIYSGAYMLAFSILAGALQYLAFSLVNIGFGLLIYLFAYMIGKEIRDRIFNYHILYSVIGVIFFFIGFLIYNISLWSFATHNISAGLNLILSAGGIKYVVFDFLNFSNYQGVNILNNILDIFLIVFCVITVWKLPESKK